MKSSSHERSGLVLSRHHDGNSAHAGNVGGGYDGGGQGGRAGDGEESRLAGLHLDVALGLAVALAVALGQRLGLGQPGGPLRVAQGQGAAVGVLPGPPGVLRGSVRVLVPGQGGSVAVVGSVLGGGGGAPLLAVLLGGPVAPGDAARGGDDGGGVGGGPLRVLLQPVALAVEGRGRRVVVLVVGVVVVLAGVEGLLGVPAGADGRQGAVLGEDVGAHAALGPGHALGGHGVLPGERGEGEKRRRVTDCHHGYPGDLTA